MRILVVEDEPLIAMMLADGLEHGGHEVIGPAASAAEALALCDAAIPDLALLDVDLRGGGNGVVPARALFGRWGLAVIFASGELAEARQANDVALGHIGKPYEVETVLRSLEVAREVMDGGTPQHLPLGFELFAAAG